MTVLLTILKIIGRIVLGLLLFVLLLVCLVLFCPVGYRVTGSIHEKNICGRARVSWLFRLVTFSAVYGDGGFSMSLRLFGFRKRLADAADRPGVADDDTGHPDDGTFGSRDAPGAGEDLTGDAQQPEREDIAAPQGRDDTPEDTGSPDEMDTAGQKNESNRKKTGTLLKRLRGKWDSFRRRLRDIRSTIRKWSQIAEDEYNRQAVSHIRKAVLRLLRCIMPRRLNLVLSYSTGSPDTTAQVFGILAMFPAGYTNRWRIHPDFEAEEAYAEGDMDIRGHFPIVRILAVLLGVLLDKKCRRLYWKISR